MTILAILLIICGNQAMGYGSALRRRCGDDGYGDMLWGGGLIVACLGWVIFP